MKNILVIANSTEIIYKPRKELIEALLKEYSVFVLAPSGLFDEELTSLGCKVIDYSVDSHGKNPFKDYKLYKYFKKIIKEINPSVVLTFTIKPNIYAGLACKALKIPFIANITGLGRALANKGILRNIAKFLYKKSLKKCSCVFFQNKNDMNFMLENKIIKDKYFLLNGSGVNLDFYEPYPYEQEEKNICFLFLGRIMKEKGIEEYLEAAKNIKEKYDNVEFVVCGNIVGEYSGKLNEYNARGYVDYIGYKKETRPLFKKADCVVLPTFYTEGVPNVLLEACACGRSCITTNRSGCNDVISDNVNGFLCKERDSIDLTKTIEKYLKLSFEEKAQMGRKSREIVSEKFDRKNIVNKYLEVISEINR